MNTCDFFGYQLLKGFSQIELSGSNKVLCALNPHSYCVAKRDAHFKEALCSADYLLPDGIGVVWAARFLGIDCVKRISGYDAFLIIMNELNRIGGKAFFLGSTDETLQRLSRRLKNEYPKVRIACKSPPFKPTFSNGESKAFCKEINDFGPDVLFVSMTAPKQEKWVHANSVFLNTKLICSIGAVFDFYAETVKRPSNFWISLGMEWFVRLMREPKRLFYRNFVSTPEFIFNMFLQKIKAVQRYFLL
ncbi:WecB/TagA/CpsF family glycosyltransferase [Flagellimonas marinaquae]